MKLIERIKAIKAILFADLEYTENPLAYYEDLIEK